MGKKAHLGMTVRSPLIIECKVCQGVPNKTKWNPGG